MPLLGMYMHTHWAYGNPYAVRTWSLDQWKGYLTGLARLGYDLVQIWPMLDTMPVPPTPSDRAQLDRMRSVIRFAREALGMTVYLGISPNTSCNDNAARCAFEQRRYFECEALVDPADREAMDREMERRRILFEDLVECDGIWILDCDPGGYDGSTVEQFADIFHRHRRMLDGIGGDHIRIVYWMWAGWTGGRNRFDPEWTDHPQACWTESLRAIAALDLEPWGIHACWEGHFQAVESLGLSQKAHFYPYNLIENEPSYPFTNWCPGTLASELNRFAAHAHPMGTLGNSQNHCIQIPHAYVFSHLARGGSLDTLNPAQFAERLIPGHAETLAAAWESVSLTEQDPAAPRRASERLRRILAQDPIPTGDLEGLLFGSPKRYVEDLRLQLDLWGNLLELRNEPGDGYRLRTLLREMVASLEAWTARHRFADRYIDRYFWETVHPIYAASFEALGTDDGRQAAEYAREFTRQGHGATTRLIARMKAAL